jgi:hypothetical protein
VVGVGGGPRLIAIRLRLCLSYRSFARLVHDRSMGGVSVTRVRCACQVATATFVVDAEIVLRVLVVVLGGDPIVTSRRFLRQREITLVNLGGASSDTFARAMSAERLIVLLPLRRLMGWPVWIKATARSLIGSRSHNARIGRFALFAQKALPRIPLSSLEANIKSVPFQ